MVLDIALEKEQFLIGDQHESVIREAITVNYMCLILSLSQSWRLNGTTDDVFIF